jgi:chromosome partitioning protein
MQTKHKKSIFRLDFFAILYIIAPLSSFQTIHFMVDIFIMAQIMCIANQKGGVGKTTTAVNLSAALAVSEKRTLLVDCDPQGNATTGLGLDKKSISETLYHGMIGKVAAERLVMDSDIETLKIIPSRVDLIGFEVEMMSKSRREMSLKRLLSKIEDSFDYIIIDCPPSLSLLTVNALTAAEWMLIPLQCEFYALEGLGQLLETMKRIRNNLNPRLKIAGILLTMFDKRTNLSRQVAGLGEAPSFGKPILLYDATSTGAQSYFSLAKEIMDNSYAR